MKILLTGASGMLGSVLIRHFLAPTRRSQFTVFATSRSPLHNGEVQHRSFDLAEKSYLSLFEWSKPDVIIHCAALTQIDQCEKDHALARAINVDSVTKFIHAIEDSSHASKLFFISSDAVKAEGQPMADESCETRPLNFYGQTKLQAELEIETSSIQATAIRTTIVGSKKAQSQSGFADWIVESVQAKKPVSLFEDVFFTPISCARLASHLQALFQGSNLPKVLNISGGESVSKFEFGKTLVESLGMNTDFIKASSLKDSGLTASRLKDQTLSSKNFSQITGIEAPSLLQTVQDLVELYPEFNLKGNQNG